MVIMKHFRKPLLCDSYIIVNRYNYDSVTGLITARQDYGPKNNKKAKGDVCGFLHQGYLVVNVNNKRFYLHRVCWFLHFGTWPTSVLDHINGNPTDNRISNLREVTQSVNCRGYKSVSKNSSSKYRGVTKVKNRWRAQLNVPNSNTHIGYFSSEVEAALAFNRRAILEGFSKEALNVV